MIRPHVTVVVGVCDEVEIIGRCLDHLERQHADSIVVVDMLSRDGTRELLRNWRRLGRIALVERDNDPNRDGDFLLSGVECARRTFNPDWILIQDADEFCVHASGDLHDALGTDATAVGIDRYNACLGERLLEIFADSRKDIETCEVWVAPLRLSRDFMDQNPAIAWSTAQPAPKVLARATEIGGVTAGGHSVLSMEGAPHEVSWDPRLLIVHVPFLSFSRFRTKIARAKALIAEDRTYFKGSIAWHWRRWIEIANDGALEVEYRNQIVTEAKLDELRRRKVIERADRYLVGRATRS